MTRILILCTGNSCRSQMAEGFLQSFDPTLRVMSAGTHPARRVHPLAVSVMHEAGIDISRNGTNNVDEFIHESFDYVVTVCDDAKEACPSFSGRVGQTLHMSFDDPAAATGTDEQILSEFRRIRDLIHREFGAFAENLRQREKKANN